MAARVGLTRADVVDAALAVANEEGYPALNVTALARRLGIRSQSVYAHFDDIEAIRRALQLRSYQQLGEAIQQGVGDLRGRAAVLAWTNAHLRFDLAHPGLFCSRNRPPGDDPELWEVINGQSATALAVLASYGIHGEEAMHLMRLVWATLYGFVSLHHNGLLTLPVDPEDSLQRMLDGLADQIEQRSRALAGGSGSSAA